MTLNKVKYRDFIAPLLVGLIIWLSSPIKPASVSMNAWHIFAILSQLLLVVLRGRYQSRGCNHWIDTDRIIRHRADGYGGCRIWE